MRTFVGRDGEPPLLDSQRFSLFFIRSTSGIRAAFSAPGLFRWAVLLLAALWLFVFWQNSQNGRYFFNQNMRIVIDTRTGQIWRVDFTKLPTR